MTKSILIVDDEKNTREGLRNSLDEDYDVYVAADIAGAKAVMETDRIDLLLTDLRLGAESGMDLLEWTLRQPNAPVCIIMTAYGTVEAAVDATKRGAYDFGTKPVNIDRLEILIKRALHGSEIEKENVRLREQIDKRYGLESFVGDSPAMEQALDTIRQVASSRATVLITGESGTGKELAAHAIHRLSPRHRGPFVAVHCAALSPQLLESELFGHERGAFTGAGERRIGRFEMAAGGTLFLDEIGEIDTSTQVKVLRVLGERTFERVGGNKPITADVRLLAATTRALPQMVSEESSARTSFSASTSCRCIFRRCATAGRTSRRWRCISCAKRRRKRQALPRTDCRRHEMPAGLRLAGQCARVARGHRARGRHGWRPKITLRISRRAYGRGAAGAARRPLYP